MKCLRMVSLAEVPVLLLAGIQSKEPQSTVQRVRTRLPQEGPSVRQDYKDAGNSE